VSARREAAGVRAGEPRPEPAAQSPSFSVVVPTKGGPGLQGCLETLAAARGPLPERVVVVDDRRDRDLPLSLRVPPRLAGRCVVIPGAARSPAAARNLGWLAVRSQWVAFVEDDVLLGADWLAELATDLTRATEAADPTAGVQGLLTVPLPSDRPLTDAERAAAALASAHGSMADMAYRREALHAVGGFDERFRQAHREDADLALRMLDAGRSLRRGSRRSVRPIPPVPWWQILRAQAENADDPLMRRLHGRDWRQRAAAPPSRSMRHLATTAAGLGALAIWATALRGSRSSHAGRGREHAAWRMSAGALLGAWGALTGEFVAARLRQAPKSTGEIAAFVATTVLIPPVASSYWLRGLARAARIPRPER
jgi:hypothetical protein